MDRWRVEWKQRDNKPPPGYINGVFSAADERARSQQDVERETLLYQSAMGTARSPFPNIFMTGFMLWMTGSTLQIFSIMMLFMALFNPTKAIVNVNNVFAKYKHPNVDLLAPKVIFIILQLVVFGMALYKCQTLGLLPSGVPPPVDPSALIIDRIAIIRKL